MAEVSKAQKVRDYLAINSDATPQEISKALSKPGAAIGARYVSKIKSNFSAAKAKQTKARVTSKKKSIKKDCIPSK
jgi:hypothetical protein